MNRVQYLLTKLAEEASEIAQIALKSQQFGVHEICPDLLESNIERINKEFNDLLGVVCMINIELEYEALSPTDDFIENKIRKVEKYYQYSIECGQVIEEIK